MSTGSISYTIFFCLIYQNTKELFIGFAHSHGKGILVLKIFFNCNYAKHYCFN